MIDWLAGLLGVRAGVAKLVLIGIGAAAVIGAVIWWNSRQDARDERNQTIGRQVEREETLRETINQTEKANEARYEVREALERNYGRNRAVYDQCVRTARTPAHCERFLPTGEADQR